MRNFCLWITGLPGCGKSTVAGHLKAALAGRGIEVEVLNLDAIRKVLTPEPAYTEAERALVYRALVLMAQLLVEKAHRNVIIDATAHRREFRALARSLIPDFAEIYLNCPLEVCKAREAGRKPGLVQAGLYQKAQAGRLKGAMPGIGVPYEEPLRPELEIPGGEKDPREAAQMIEAYVLSRWKQE